VSDTKRQIIGNPRIQLDRIEAVIGSILEPGGLLGALRATAVGLAVQIIVGLALDAAPIATTLGGWWPSTLVR
jgi:hypothetical protein